MNDYYLRASDATALYNVLEAAGIVTEGDQGWHVTDGHKYALDVIGTIYKPTGKVLQTDDGEVPEMKPVDGFHANVRVINMSDFDVNKIAEILLEPPANPVRGWA
jgi:hypothetical protein